MKFTVQRDFFARLLSRAQGIVEKKTTLTILSQVLLETVGKDTLKLTCTDYDVVLVDTCPASIEREGRLVISGKALNDVIKVLPNADVQVEKLPNDGISLRSGSSKFELNGAPSDDYPRIEKPEPEHTLNLPINVFKRMLNKVAFCMSQEEARMNLNGVLFDFQSTPEGVTLFLVATDGHRLARCAATFEGKSAPNTKGSDVIVHRKGIQEVRRILEGETGEVTIGFGSGEVVFKVGTTSLYVRLIDESYPDYNSVIPSGFNSKVTVELGSLAVAMRVVSAVTDPNLLTVRLDISGDKMEVASANPATGKGSHDVFISFDGETTRIGFNYRYLQEALNAVDSKELVIKLLDGSSPAVVEPNDPTEQFTYVIMPVEEI